MVLFLCCSFRITDKSENYFSSQDFCSLSNQMVSFLEKEYFPAKNTNGKTVEQTSVYEKTKGKAVIPL